MDNARALAGRLRERARYDTAVDPLKLLIEAADLLDRLAAPEGVGLTRYTRAAPDIPCVDGEFVRYEDAAAAIAAASERVHYAEGTADLAMTHRDVAEAERDALKAALEFYANPDNWWNRDVGGVRWHNANLTGSMERYEARIGTFDKWGNWHNDCGDKARAILSPASGGKASG